MNSSNEAPLYVLGVDGGGSKTSAWIATATKPSRASASSVGSKLVGEILGKGDAGPGNPNPIGYDAACANILEAIQEALRSAQLGIGLAELDGICIGLAGVARVEERTILENWLVSQGAQGKWKVTNDIEPIRWAAQTEWEWQQAKGRKVTEETRDAEDDLPLLYGGSTPSPWENAITLIAGTGSIALAHRSDGHSARAGGWGYLLGDAGSGFWIGLSALKLICVRHDRGEALTSLDRELLDKLQLKEPTQLITWIYQSTVPRSQIAQLAPTILRYRAEDEDAARIGKETGEAWKELVATAAKRTGLYDGFGLALAGGIPNHCPDLVDEFVERLRKEGILATSHWIVESPVLGCLAIAASLID